MGKWLSLGQANPFNTSLYGATAMVQKKVKEKQQISQTDNHKKNDNNTEAKGDDTKTDQVGLHVVKSVKSSKESSKYEHPINKEANPTTLEDQVGT